MFGPILRFAIGLAPTSLSHLLAPFFILSFWPLLHFEIGLFSLLTCVKETKMTNQQTITIRCYYCINI